MALTECKECGGKVSTEADSCPHCGYREKKVEEPKAENKEEPKYQGSVCSNCGHPFSVGANKCLNCGKQNDIKTASLWVFGISILVIIFMIIGAFSK